VIDGIVAQEVTADLLVPTNPYRILSDLRL